LRVDTAGSCIAVVKMEPAQAYTDVPQLLKSVIDGSDIDSWNRIKKKIDYIYNTLDYAFAALERETGFTERISLELKKGKKLLFKPNLVNPTNIDPTTHGEGLGNSACTEWPFTAALMRWFHDKLDVPFNQMALGEAASVTSMVASYFNLAMNLRRTITTEAVIEGRSGDFYGGWGFYFVRKYLVEAHDSSHEDNPMNGFEESVSGKYLPPGTAGNRLMVYDLNRMYDVKGKARTVPVSDGVNFKEIALSKVIVGGEPSDAQDLKDYPGCVLVNVPRLKVHAIDLLTNAVKNLGIGLYPMEVTDSDDPKITKWKYSFPFKMVPGMKTEIPHAVWVPKMDDETGLPLRNERGEYTLTKTGGIAATQVDVIKAAVNQGVFILHVVDAVQAVNVSHTGDGTAVKVPEGLVFASLNPVTLDLLCARYCFKTVPMSEARKLQKERALACEFLQKVPIPEVEGHNIVTREGYDSPLLRYGLLAYAESRGLGQQKYYVTGWDVGKKAPLVSLGGHLGWIEEGEFHEMITNQFYYNPSNMLWGLQSTVFAYLDANDLLTGSSYHKEMLDAFDENGDGVLDYDEMGKKGFWHPVLRIGAYGYHLRATEKYGFLRGSFISSRRIKYGNEKWNAEGHDFLKEYQIASAAALAYRMSQTQTETTDPFFPSMTWGKGKWPSLQYAVYAAIVRSIYGTGYPAKVSLSSLYGYAFQYADKKLNYSRYTGSSGTISDPESVSRYIQAVQQGAEQLDFILYVPMGYGSTAGKTTPNVQETEDPERILTARFMHVEEVW